jgi:hypothetical protein
MLGFAVWLVFVVGTAPNMIRVTFGTRSRTIGWPAIVGGGWMTSQTVYKIESEVSSEQFPKPRPYQPRD